MLKQVVLLLFDTILILSEKSSLKKNYLKKKILPEKKLLGKNCYWEGGSNLSGFFFFKKILLGKIFATEKILRRKRFCQEKNFYWVKIFIWMMGVICQEFFFQKNFVGKMLPLLGSTQCNGINIIIISKEQSIL